MKGGHGMRFEEIRIDVDVTVVGAGIPGICAAIQAARLGQKVALINNRGFLGGNASPEIRIHICGADGSGEFNFYSREGGILEELRLENLYRNPQGNVYQWHNVLMDAIVEEDNIQLFLNTNIDQVEMIGESDTIDYVAGSQLSSEKRFIFHSPIFVDDTGDGTIGYLSGAEYRMGREGKREFNEKIAPDEADDQVTLSTLSFYSKDTGRKAPFSMPKYAQNMKVESALAYREIPDRIPGDSRYEGYRMQWFYEIGHGRNQIKDAEVIIRDHRELVYGVWNHIKNSGKYDSENFDLEYVSGVPGKRESRRLIGDYILSEKDVVNQTDFEDVVGHGGWSIDLHAMEGFFSKELINRHYILRGIYQVPLRSIYSKDVYNLFMPSRCMSATHVAFGTTRVMGTLSTLGQAVGVAATLCKKYSVKARDIYRNHLKELQQVLYNNDQYLIGFKSDDEKNLVKSCNIEASSEKKCDVINHESWVTVDVDTALIVPVNQTLNTLKIKVRAQRDTTLYYHVYTPEKKENYDPYIKLLSGSVQVKETMRDIEGRMVKEVEEGDWISIPICCESTVGKLFIEIQKNSDIKIAFSGEKLNGVFALRKELLERHTTYSDIDTLEIRRDLWQQTATLPAFMMEPEMNVYSKDYLSNGYNRNYGLPNLWLSDDMTVDKQPTVKITFEQPKLLRELVLTFDSNLNLFYDNLEVYYDTNVIPTLVKDYDVYTMNEGVVTLVASVEDNHMRVNRLKLDKAPAEGVIVIVKATNGATKAGIYDIRVYE